MSDEAGRFTAEHTVMDKNVEIREQAHLLEQRDKIISDLTKKVKESEQEISQLKNMVNQLRQYFSVAEEAEAEEEDEEEHKQLSFELH